MYSNISDEVCKIISIRLDFSIPTTPNQQGIKRCCKEELLESPATMTLSFPIIQACTVNAFRLGTLTLGITS